MAQCPGNEPQQQLIIEEQRLWNQAHGQQQASFSAAPCDNGSEQESHRLTEPDTALIVRAGVWIRLREFGEGARVVVLSSCRYEEVKHFDAPVPALLDEVEP